MRLNETMFRRSGDGQKAIFHAPQGYMDDVLILAPTRWKLREAIRVLNQTFSELRLEKHPDKTFIGRIEKGFDFLGYHFSPEGLSMAEKTIEKFLARAVRLYEQEREEPCGSPLLGLYVERWVRWVRGIASINTAQI
jgi:RNA-directed DNA polymerase